MSEPLLVASILSALAAALHGVLGKSFNDPFDGVVPSLLQTPGTVVKRFAEEFVDRKFPSSSPDGWLTKVSKLMSVDALKGLRQDVSFYELPVASRLECRRDGRARVDRPGSPGTRSKYSRIE